ncbi:MAG: hypothetical protein DRJ96_09560 [Thermoprotei archaeon]|nr:MAG: hypothetical protein DRJ67_07545 [Thermoprotei archaeon]RLE94206.1 MAG: hypothetical protein DRJ96_09560 [Thermoprotei archaeon]
MSEYLEVIEVYEVRLRSGGKKYFAYARDPDTALLYVVKLDEEEARRMGVDHVVAEDELDDEDARELLGLPKKG